MILHLQILYPLQVHPGHLHIVTLKGTGENLPDFMKSTLKLVTEESVVYCLGRFLDRTVWVL